MYYRRQQELKRVKKQNGNIEFSYYFRLGGKYIDDDGIIRQYSYNSSKVRRQHNRSLRRQLKRDYNSYSQGSHKKMTEYKWDIL